MIPRLAALLAMAAFGLAVYLTLGALRSHVSESAVTPTAVTHRIDLPGTMYLAQGGVLYRLKDGSFARLSPGPSGRWMQPAISPDGKRLVAVNRQSQFSDLYLLDLGGKVLKQLTDDSGPHGTQQHWAFYPRFSPDGQSIYYSFDSPKFVDDFRVDFAVWAMAVDGGQRAARRQSTFNNYTGGDVQAIPLAGGSAAAGGPILYSKYGIGGSGPFSQLWYQARTLSPGKPLTEQQDDCGQPALSPDGKRVAMVCTGGLQTGKLEVATFDPDQGLGEPRVLAIGMLGSPAWSPDGKTLAYLAPAGAAKHFQLWTVPVPADLATPTAALARQLTDNLDFDGTSAPVWL